MPVTTLSTLPASVGSNVICVVLSAVTRLPYWSCTSTVIVVLPPALKLAPATVISTNCAAAGLTVTVSTPGGVSTGTEAIATVKVSATVSASVTDATPPTTVTPIAAPGVPGVPLANVPVTTLAIVASAVLGVKVITVVPSVGTRFPYWSCTWTVSVALPSAAKSAGTPVTPT